MLLPRKSIAYGTIAIVTVPIIFHDDDRSTHIGLCPSLETHLHVRRWQAINMNKDRAGCKSLFLEVAWSGISYDCEDDGMAVCPIVMYVHSSFTRHNNAHRMHVRKMLQGHMGLLQGTMLQNYIWHAPFRSSFWAALAGVTLLHTIMFRDGATAFGRGKGGSCFPSFKT
jgi:hypothetical protein